ncbi:MAG TPA: LPXTG cell wall anchor domain-containing protein [Vicinamibacterales bacterium]|jgi:LPXTG-motif cell wall-anchored protein|nr:LPXTG cell wall anchor domain-containing protein [Vicinamibacterales bacterium]
MTRALSHVVLATAILGLTAAGSQAQTTTSSSETKTFTVLAVQGNTLVVRLPEGTRELTVPDDFRFTINGQPMSVHQLTVGMNGTATITTRTTVTPVTVTEVKNGTVALRSGGSVIVRTDEGVKSFTQGDIDKRGVKVFMNGKAVQLSDLHEGDKLSATIVTSRPPRIVTEKEVQALANAAPPAPVAESTRAAAAPAARPAGQAPASEPARTLPSTASSWPLLALASVVMLAMACGLTVRRRRME